MECPLGWKALHLLILAHHNLMSSNLTMPNLMLFSCFMNTENFHKNVFMTHHLSQICICLTCVIRYSPIKCIKLFELIRPVNTKVPNYCKKLL